VQIRSTTFTLFQIVRGLQAGFQEMVAGLFWVTQHLGLFILYF